MKIYGVKYEDYVSGLESWVDDDVYKTRDAAIRIAAEKANANAAEYEDCAVIGGPMLGKYIIMNEDGDELEGFVIVEFNLAD